MGVRPGDRGGHATALDVQSTFLTFLDMPDVFPAVPWDSVVLKPELLSH
jgi:hypothetical protein